MQASALYRAEAFAVQAVDVKQRSRSLGDTARRTFAKWKKLSASRLHLIDLHIAT